MHRRDFLSAVGMTAGYSLTVNAGAMAAGPLPIANPGRRTFEAVAPAVPGAAPPTEPHMAVVELACDVFVAGVGLAGVLAAVAAARNGATVVLVQDRSRLGGNSSSEVKMHVVGADCHGGRPGWRESGLVEEFRLDDAVRNPYRSWELWDLLLYDKVVSDPNITLLLDTTLCAAEVRDGKITRVTARCDKTEHLYRVTAKVYCDCTGDSRLALEAGAEFRTGREARAEFDEPLGLPTRDDGTLGSSILFTAREHDKPVPFTPPKWARKVTEDMLKFRKITSWEYGYWWIEWGGAISTIRDNERIRFELLGIVLGVWDYIKNSGRHPTSENWAIDWIGMVPGKRGSRRIVGDYTLTQHDLANPKTDFDDAVAVGGWAMDDHPPGGFDRPDLKPFIPTHLKEVYNIPLRACYSKTVGNLMMAGRNISCSHVAFTSTRVMATCGAVGQAVGTAAALCARHGLTPRGLYENKARLAELRQTLLRDDQTIKHGTNEDAADLARTAAVSASASFDHAPARNVINGVTRDILGDKPNNPPRAINRWTTPLVPNGTWLELTWEKPQSIREVLITFDTGFQRELTLSSSDAVSKKVVRGPQPETIRDYTLMYRPSANAPWVEWVKVNGNYQRLNRLRFDPVEATAIRLQIHATNGDRLARVFGVRCYS